MRTAFVGRFSGWMGIHMNQMAAAWRACGHELFCFDYPSLQRKWLWFRRPQEEFNALLAEQLRRCRPELVLINMSHSIYDFGMLRQTLPDAKFCVWDFDGPNWCCLQDPGLAELDLLLTVSRKTEQALLQRGVKAAYLPHGVDCSYYCSRGVTPKFQAPVSYIGKATPRRIAICSRLQEEGLALYGRRWHREAAEKSFRKCIRSRKDVIGEDVVRIYSSSTCMINLLQGKLAEEHTILSLQVFAVPASEGCLITEKTVELEESFVPDRELLCFESEEELVDKVRWAVRHPEAARRIGAAGRQRCLKSHTQTERVGEILALLKR